MATLATPDISTATLADIEKAVLFWLENNVGKFKNDPLGFVLHYFEWTAGEGPDEWQSKFFNDLGKSLSARAFDGYTPVDPIKMAVASGRGPGKSALMAMLFWFIMITRKNAKGRVTANTFTQLQVTTWAEIQKWHKRLRVFRERFEITDTRCWEKGHRDSWFAIPLTCSEENSEAFAGQHNRESTSFFLFDESSLIPELIWQVAERSLTDGESLMFAFGNPTRNTGRFHDVCFGTGRAHWNQRSIDARTCKFPNKEEQRKLIEQYGIDSDTCRVEILGLPPHQSEMQLISRSVVEEAQRRQIAAMATDPLVAGVDVPDGGSAWFTVAFRRGLDARPGPLVPHPIRLAGSKINREAMVSRLAQVLSDRDPLRKVSMMFVDAAYGAPIVERLHALGFMNVQEIRFGGPSLDPGYANMRAYMWGKMMKDWLERGAIDKEDKRLEMELTAPGFHHKVGGDGALVLESKAEMQKRGIPSPDAADSLCLTWAAPVAPPPVPMTSYRTPGTQHSWMG